MRTRLTFLSTFGHVGKTVMSGGWHPGEEAIKHLLSRGTHREFGYAALLVMLAFYFSGAVWAAGSAIASGLFVPMLLIGSCVGRIVGLIAVDIAAHAGYGSPGYRPCLFVGFFWWSLWRACPPMLATGLQGTRTTSGVLGLPLWTLAPMLVRGPLGTAPASFLRRLWWPMRWRWAPTLRGVRVSRVPPLPHCWAPGAPDVGTPVGCLPSSSSLPHALDIGFYTKLDIGFYTKV